MKKIINNIVALILIVIMVAFWLYMVPFNYNAQKPEFLLHVIIVSLMTIIGIYAIPDLLNTNEVDS